MFRPLSFWFILFSAYLYGVSVVNISGTVTDIYKNPLPGANVLIQNTVFGGVTDLNGAYNISVSTKTISDNSAIIKTSFIGYKSKSDTIRYRGNDNILINIELVQDVLGLDAVVVTGLGVLICWLNIIILNTSLFL